VVNLFDALKKSLSDGGAAKAPAKKARPASKQAKAKASAPKRKSA
jgi:DNA end-binding protein Ku